MPHINQPCSRRAVGAPWWNPCLAVILISAGLGASLIAQAPAATAPPTDPSITQERAQGPPAASDAADDPLLLWTGGRYRITPSDVLELRFPYVPEFDQTVTVQPDGYIPLRAVGELRAQGRSVPELQAMLVTAYRDVLQQPVITIALKEFEKPYFIVTGEVLRPGKIELRGATTLTQGLVLAGGQTAGAKSSQVILFRRFSTEWLEVKEIDVKKMYASRNLSEDPLLRPGDTIYVPKTMLAKIAPLIPRPSLGFYLNPLSR
jgi:polysaccharide biosynthesis/export protein